MFLPKGRDNCPAIVLLHDSAGLTVVPGTIFRQCSRLLASEGYAVFLAHYFDASGHTALQPAQVKKAKEHWPEWHAAARDAVRFAVEHPRVDGQRVGVLGFSLGAYLSIALAADSELGVAAVAEFFGGLPKTDKKLPPGLRLPPMFIVHGRKDRIVPLGEVHALCALLKARHAPFEMKLYECGHLFKGTQLKWKAGGTRGSLWDIDGDIADARDRTLRFFAKHLGKKTN